MLLLLSRLLLLQTLRLSGVFSRRPERGQGTACESRRGCMCCAIWKVVVVVVRQSTSLVVVCHWFAWKDDLHGDNCLVAPTLLSRVTTTGLSFLAGEKFSRYSVLVLFTAEILCCALFGKGEGWSSILSTTVVLSVAHAFRSCSSASVRSTAASALVVPRAAHLYDLI